MLHAKTTDVMPSQATNNTVCHCKQTPPPRTQQPLPRLENCTPQPGKGNATPDILWHKELYTSRSGKDNASPGFSLKSLQHLSQRWQLTHFHQTCTAQGSQVGYCQQICTTLSLLRLAIVWPCTTDLGRRQGPAHHKNFPTTHHKANNTTGQTKLHSRMASLQTAWGARMCPLSFTACDTPSLNLRHIHTVSCDFDVIIRLDAQLTYHPPCGASCQ